MGPGTILVAALAFGVIVLISKSIRVVQQAQTMIIERLGKYHKTLASGINFVLPVIDRPRSVDWHQTIITPAGDSYSRRFRTERIDLRETVYVFPRQNVITKDNVVVEIDALIYSQITDPVRATYEIANLPDAIEKLTQPTLSGSRAFSRRRASGSRRSTPPRVTSRRKSCTPKRKLRPA